MRVKWLVAWLTAVTVSAVGFLAWRVGLLGFPPEELFSRVTQLLGVPRVFQVIHAIFGVGQGGKMFAFAGVAGLWLVGVTVLARLRPWVGASLFAAALLALTAPVTAAAYAALFLMVRLALPALLVPVSAPDRERRALLGALGGGSALLVGSGLFGLFRGVSGMGVTPELVPGGPLPVGVTPVKDFYYVSKNLEPFDPKIQETEWRLQIDGLVREERSFTLAELRDRPARTLELTLACISNPVGGPLLGNGIWQGFSVRELLQEVGVRPGARFVVWHAADGYTESLPLGEAFEEDVLLVYALNGQPLSRKHGFPLRVLIPGRYGMKQPRWIDRITVTDHDEPGYWVRRGWSKTARIHLSSRIDHPREVNPILRAGEATVVRGVAFGGLLPITRVEVSRDGGSSWEDARLERPRSRHAWTRWSLPWTPEAGSYQLVVRASSGDRMQDASERDALPEGSTGYHRFIVNVS